MSASRSARASKSRAASSSGSDARVYSAQPLKSMPTASWARAGKRLAGSVARRQAIDCCLAQVQRPQTAVERLPEPAGHALIEDGIDLAAAHGLQPCLVARPLGIADVAAPGLDVSQPEAVGCERFIQEQPGAVRGILPDRHFEGKTPVLQLLQCAETGTRVHGAHEAIP